MFRVSASVGNTRHAINASAEAAKVVATSVMISSQLAIHGQPGGENTRSLEIQGPQPLPVFMKTFIRSCPDSNVSVSAISRPTQAGLGPSNFSVLSVIVGQ